MNLRCTSLATLAVVIALGAGPAGAQPSAPLPDAEPPPDAALETRPESDPRIPPAPESPEEERAQRNERLDSLFARLATAERDGWERVQTEIWAMWSQSGSDTIDLLLARAAKAMDERDLDLALRFLDDLVRLAPDFAEGWNKRATVHFLREDYGRSIADIQQTLALEPRHFGAMSGLGIILERLGDKKGAMQAFRRGLEIHPHLPNAQDAVDRLSPEVDGRSL